jgi:hypothetical protein
MLDFSAVFDIIDHNLLLKKMCVLWLFNLCHIMDSELSNRTQRVPFNGSFSNVKHVKCRVPQGSCLGPLLCSIFTNDLPLALTSLGYVGQYSPTWPTSSENSDRQIQIKYYKT